MKLFHIADLHLGKRVNEFDMIDVQTAMLSQIIEAIKEHKPNGLIIAGDVYDRSVPSSTAVSLFDDFLNALNEIDIKVFIIAGNHDSRERLSFASNILKQSNIFITANITKDIVREDMGNVSIYMVPFLRPAYVRNALDNDVRSYDEAFASLVNNVELDTNRFNIMVAHQFFTSQNQEPEKSDSEVVSVGGIDNIDTAILKDFDYVALGHIHRPQSIGGKHIRYGGSILKYSLSEVNHQKSIVVIDVEDKEGTLSFINLIPNQDMVHLEGDFDTIMKAEKSDDFTFVTLLDESEVVDAVARLRSRFPYLMSIRYKNQRMAFDNTESLSYEALHEMNPLSLFNDFYKRQNNTDLTKEQKEQVAKIMEDIHETY